MTKFVLYDKIMRQVVMLNSYSTRSSITTARCAVSVEILSTAAQLCRNKVNNKSTTNRMELESCCQPTCNKLCASTKV